MDRGAERATVRGVTKSQIGPMQLSIMHTLPTKPPEAAARAWIHLSVKSDYATLQKNLTLK